MIEVHGMRRALLVLAMLTVTVPAVAAGAAMTNNAGSRAHAVLHGTLLGLVHHPGPSAAARVRTGPAAGVQARSRAVVRSTVPAGAVTGARRQAVYRVAPGHGVVGGPTTRPAVMALSGVRRRP
jgi:hypothetical protein